MFAGLYGNSSLKLQAGNISWQVITHATDIDFSGDFFLSVDMLYL
jgi:hypothetical protein